jgi:hypothetical protein
MAKGGKRYRLILYQHMLDRWWHATLALGIFMLLFAGSLAVLPPVFPNLPFFIVDDLTLTFLAVVGGMAILFSIFLIVIRKAAYVQALPEYLRLATPFWRLNISYKRFQKTTTADFGNFLTANSVSGWQREIIYPLSSFTAIRIDFTANPVPRWQMKFFLSPLFFADKTPHIILLVGDWMGLSGELESMRINARQAQRPGYYGATGQESPRPAASQPKRPRISERSLAPKVQRSSILSNLKDDKKDKE